MSSEPNWDEVNQDKEKKKLAVLEHIKSRCTSSSDIDDLRTINSYLSNGSEINIEILTGGLANYSYAVSCEDVKIFAKLSFPFAQLFPDKPCPLSRTDNEFVMMKKFNALNPSLVSTPYFCDDIGDDMKLLVTQYSPVDEQFGNQFIDGSVDKRTADKIAEGLSRLHLKETHTEELQFNIEMKPWVQSLTPILDQILDDLYNPDNSNRVATLAKQLGKDKTNSALDSYVSTIDESECLIHADCHAFNLLVGKKPSIESLQEFEESGSVVFVDFEMSRGGIPATDIGPLRAFPISCAFAHALNGHRSAADNCIDWVTSFWSAYEAKVRNSGLKTEDVKKIYIQAMQYSALYLLAGYGIGVHMEYLPVDQDNTKDLERVKESIGIVGLKFLMYGMDTETELSLEKLKAQFLQAIEEEVSQLISVKKVRRNRRSSMLRMSGRRVSDGNIRAGILDRKSTNSTNSAKLLGMIESDSAADGVIAMQ